MLSTFDSSPTFLWCTFKLEILSQSIFVDFVLLFLLFQTLQLSFFLPRWVWRLQLVFLSQLTCLVLLFVFLPLSSPILQLVRNRASFAVSTLVQGVQIPPFVSATLRLPLFTSSMHRLPVVSSELQPPVVSSELQPPVASSGLRLHYTFSRLLPTVAFGVLHLATSFILSIGVEVRVTRVVHSSHPLLFARV